MEIKELDKKDWNKVIQYAIKGMHFDEYLDNNFLLKAYGRYFWYLEYTNATQVISAYDGNDLLGVLVVDMKNKEKPNKSIWRSMYIGLVDFIQNVFFGGGVMPYNDANKAMFADYTKNIICDGSRYGRDNHCSVSIPGHSSRAALSVYNFFTDFLFPFFI